MNELNRKTNNNYEKLDLIIDKLKKKLPIGEEVYKNLNDNEFKNFIHNKSSNFLSIEENLRTLADDFTIITSLVFIAIEKYQNNEIWPDIRDIYSSFNSKYNNFHESIIRNIISHRYPELINSRRKIDVLLILGLIPLNYLDDFVSLINSVFITIFNYTTPSFEDFESIMNKVFIRISNETDINKNEFLDKINNTVFFINKSTKSLILHEIYLRYLIEFSYNIVLVLDSYLNNKDFSDNYIKGYLDKWINLNLKNIVKQKNKTQNFKNFEPNFSFRGNRLFLKEFEFFVPIGLYDSFSCLLIQHGKNQVLEAKILDRSFVYSILVSEFEILENWTDLLIIVNYGMLKKEFRIRNEFLAFNENGEILRNNSEYYGYALILVKDSYVFNGELVIKTDFYKAYSINTENNKYLILNEKRVFSFRAIENIRINGLKVEEVLLDNNSKYDCIYKRIDSIDLPVETHLVSVEINNKKIKIEELNDKKSIFNYIKTGSNIINIETQSTKKLFYFIYDENYKIISRLGLFEIYSEIKHFTSESKIIEKFEYNLSNDSQRFYLLIDGSYVSARFDLVLPRISFDGKAFETMNKYIWAQSFKLTSVAVIKGIKADYIKISNQEGFILPKKILHKQFEIDYNASRELKVDSIKLYNGNQITDIYYIINENVVDSNSAIYKYNPDAKVVEISIEIFGENNNELIVKLDNKIISSKFVFKDRVMEVNNIVEFKQYSFNIISNDKTLYSRSIVFSSENNIVGQIFKIDSVNYDYFVKFKEDYGLEKSVSNILLKVVGSKDNRYNVEFYSIETDGELKNFNNLKEVSLSIINPNNSSKIEASLLHKSNELLYFDLSTRGIPDVDLEKNFRSSNYVMINYVILKLWEK